MVSRRSPTVLEDGETLHFSVILSNDFDALLTVHLSIILVINHLNAQNLVL